MTKLIVIFNKDLSVAAFLNFNGEKVLVEFINERAKENVEKFLVFLEENKPKIKKETVSEDGNVRTLFLETVEKSDPRYLDALVFELSQRGLLASVIPESLKDILLLLSNPQIPFEEREKVMGDLLNSSPEGIEEVKEMIEDVNNLVREIESNRRHWQDFLDNKKKEYENT